MKEKQAFEAQFNKWEAIESEEDEVFEAFVSSSESSLDSSINSVESSSSELAEDASSSSSSFSNSSLPPLSPLFELSELMATLPIKRGLSKFYEGKSQSFTSLASAKSLEDLIKRGNIISQRKRIKSCKSYGGGLDAAHKYSFSPKPIITKKPFKGSFLSPLCKRNLSSESFD